MTLPRSKLFGTTAILLGMTLLCTARSSIAKAPTPAKAPDKKSYITQTYIDTVIQRAFERFNTEMSSAGQAEFKQREVIEEAKVVVKKLRHIAKGNPNEKYILFKTAELDQQITLEERDLLNKEAEKRQKAVNALCDTFNIATGRKRPDFVALNRIVSQMAGYDPAKADELDELVAQRNRGISREVVSFIDYAFEHDDKERARSEIDYALANRGVLLIPADRLDAYENRLQSILDLDDMKRFIDNDMKRLDRQLAENRFGNARNILFILNSRADALRPKIAKKEINYFANGISALKMTLDRKEDSLIQYGIELIGRNGIDAGKAYMGQVLYPSGVALEKIGLVDQTILEISRALEQNVQTPLTRELDNLAAETPCDGADLACSMVAEARKKAQMRADSIKAAMATNAQLDSIRLASFHGSAAKLKENEDKALAYVQVIYDRIDQGNPTEARKLFKKQNGFIQKFTPVELYATLEHTVDQAFADYEKKMTRK